MYRFPEQGYMKGFRKKCNNPLYQLETGKQVVRG